MKEHMKSDADLTWIDDDAPYSKRFEDRYFSEQDGGEEAVAVFIAGNGLPERWGDTDLFQIAELGFGTGLNFFATLAAWYNFAPETASLAYTAFERYPLESDDMRRALKPWPELAPIAEPWLEVWPRLLHEPVLIGPVELELVIGDARTSVPQWPNYADAWYLDGFSPAKNPELWESDLMHGVFDHTLPGGTFSTYTAAGFVRRNLQAAGFDVRRVQGFGKKRGRLQGHRVR